MSWKATLTHIQQNWRTSAQSLLTAAIALGTYFTVTPSNVLSQKLVGEISLGLGAAKIVLGMLQSDAKPKLPTT